MTDAYDDLRADWCDAGDMPRATCAHCGAHPGGPSLPPLDRPWTFDGQGVTRRSGRDVFQPSAMVAPPSGSLEPIPRSEKLPKATCHYDGELGWCTTEHVRDCADPPCRGGRPCAEDHCEIDRCAQHVEHAAGIYTCPRCIRKARRRVREILDLYALADSDVDARLGLGPLLDQAGESGVDSEAFNLVGPAADPGQYAERRRRLGIAYAQRGWCDWPRREDFREDDPQHPYAVLGRWDMAIRESYGPQTDLLVTVSSAVDYLSGPVLDRFAHTQEFEDFTREVGDCLSHLEEVVHNGRQPEKGAPCPACREDGVKAKRLVKHYAVHPGLPAGVGCALPPRTEANRKGCGICGGYEDTWHCPTNPAHWWTDVDYRMRVDGDYLEHATELPAAELAERIGVSVSTVRKWAARVWIKETKTWREPLLVSRRRGADGRKLYPVRRALELAERRGA